MDVDTTIFDKKDLNSYEEFLTKDPKTADQLTNYNLECVMLLDCKPLHVSNSFPIKVGIRSNASLQTKHFKTDFSQHLLEQSFDVISGPYEEMTVQNPRPFLSETERQARQSSFLSYGPCKGREDLTRGGIIINSSTTFPLGDDVLLMPFNSLLVDLLSQEASEKTPILHLKLKASEPAIYSLIPMNYIKNVLNSQQGLVDHIQSLTNLGNIQFQVTPLLTQVQASDGLNKSQTRYKEEDLNVADDAHVLQGPRAIIIRYQLTFVALQQHQVPHLNAEPVLELFAPFFMPNTGLKITQ
jgi:hypothetical protein